ncbi:MAG: hypothetical protein ACP6IQ_04085 [Candidatus Njordarchaeia archaeon]|nr:hypothetical protein [Candidatus Korarchaeota archaeon]
MSIIDLTEKEGLIILIYEKQEGTLLHEGKEEKFDSNGQIIIYNKTGAPVYDLELSLDNIEKTSLDKKLLVNYVPEYQEGKATSIAYAITDVPIVIKLEEDLGFPPDIPKPMALKDVDVPLNTRYKVINYWRGRFKLAMEKLLPNQIRAEEIPTPERGALTVDDGQLTWSDVELDSGDKIEQYIKLVLRAETPDEFRSGVIKYTYRGEESTVSGIEIKDVRGVVKTRYYIDKLERPEQRGVWDIYIIVENQSKAPIQVSAEAEVIIGTILSPEEGGKEIPGVIEKRMPGRRDFDTVITEYTVVKPESTIKIGPITIKSDEEPKLSVEIKTRILAEIYKVIEGIFEIKDVRIPVVWGKITKEVKVLHPPYIKGLTEQQLAGHLEEPIDVTVKVQNLGSASVDRILIKDTIPADFKPPRPIDIKVSLLKGEGELDVPTELTRINTEPSDQDPSMEHLLTVELYGFFNTFGESIIKGDAIILRYKMASADPKPGTTYRLPAEADISMTAETKPLTIKLEEVPALETLEAVRKIIKIKEVLPAEEEGEYVVVAILKNDGDLPEYNYEFYDKIPMTFEYVEERAEPAPESIDEMRDGLLLRWVIPEIPAKQEVKIKYVVRGRSGHRVSDLKKILER